MGTGRITFFDLLATHLFMHLRIKLVFSAGSSLLAHIQFFIHQHFQVLISKTAFNPYMPQSVLIFGGYHDPGGRFCTWPCWTSEGSQGCTPEALKIHLDYVSSLKHMNCSTQLHLLGTGHIQLDNKNYSGNFLWPYLTNLYLKLSVMK